MRDASLFVFLDIYLINHQHSQLRTAGYFRYKDSNSSTLRLYVANSSSLSLICILRCKFFLRNFLNLRLIFTCQVRDKIRYRDKLCIAKSINQIKCDIAFCLPHQYICHHQVAWYDPVLKQVIFENSNCQQQLIDIKIISLLHKILCEIL